MYSGLLSRYAKCKDSAEVIAVQNKYLAQLEEDERIKKEEAAQRAEGDVDSEDDDLLFKNHNRDNAFTAFDDDSEEEEDSDEYSEEDSEEEGDEDEESEEDEVDEDKDVDVIVDKLGNTRIRQ